MVSISHLMETHLLVKINQVVGMTTPVNFGGSNTIEKATGALPILNTVNGGNVATVGVRTDAYAILFLQFH